MPKLVKKTSKLTVGSGCVVYAIMAGNWGLKQVRDISYAKTYTAGNS